MPGCRLHLPVGTVLLAFAACGGKVADSTVLRESFDSGDTCSRNLEVAPAQACQAAHRALLSQGYPVTRADAGSVEASKNFQPRDEVHEQLLLRVSCVGRADGRAQVFASAVQERYGLKKSPASARAGVGVPGSVSVPPGRNDDALVRVASRTVQDALFYRNFFGRLQQYVEEVAAPQIPDGAAR